MGPAGADVAAEGPVAPARYQLAGRREYTLWVFNVGLACCAVEFVAASMRRQGLPSTGLRTSERADVSGPRDADDDGVTGNVMVVSGTVTDKILPAVRRRYEEMPDPKYVISFGSCANVGGPYWDSYCVTKGVDQVIPVDVYVPGCPPRPESLLQGMLALEKKIDGGVA